MVKGIDNAFDHMELCLSYKEKSYSSENQLVLPNNYFHNRSPRKQLLLPVFLAGGKWDFPAANLLLATVTFKPWAVDSVTDKYQTGRMIQMQCSRIRVNQYFF